MQKIKKIYVACPAYFRTGGTELLHQLVSDLNKHFRIPAYIFYFDYNWKFEVPPTPSAFNKYVTDEWVDEIEDDQNNILIVPEVSTRLLRKYKQISRGLWWLSVDNFFKANKLPLTDPSSLFRLKYKLKKIRGARITEFEKLYFREFRVDFHLVQSEYAKRFVKSLHFDRVFFLSDYLNDDFLKKHKNIDYSSKGNIVVYNPLKGHEFTKQLMNIPSEIIHWLPIKKMTADQVADLLSQAKVYVDFGNHPGKDRIPREAAICGCCVVTGLKGSANNPIDIAIPDEYKVDENRVSHEDIVRKIESIVLNFENHKENFNHYRELIKSSRATFLTDLEKVLAYLDLKA